MRIEYDGSIPENRGEAQDLNIRCFKSKLSVTRKMEKDKHLRELIKRVLKI
jgi:hypothetical protein